MVGDSLYACVPALAECCGTPVAAGGVRVTRKPALAGSFGTPVQDQGEELAEEIAVYGIDAEGVQTAFCIQRYSICYRKHGVYVVSFVPGSSFPGSMLWASQEKPGVRPDARALANLKGYIGRVLLASGAVGMISPSLCRSVFRASVETAEAVLGRLQKAGARIQRVPSDMPLRKRHVCGLALDEYAVVSHSGGSISLYSGSGIDSLKGELLPYVAVSRRSLLFRTKRSSRLADACEAYLADEGAARLDVIKDWP